MTAMKNQWSRRKGEVAVFAAVSLLCFVVGMMLTVQVGDDSDIKRLFPFGIMLLLVGMILTHLIQNVLGLVYEFNLAISMSVTRRRFTLSYLAFSALELFGALLLAVVLQGAETLIGTWVCPELPIIKLFSGESIHIVLLAMVGILAVEMLAGALILRFGYKVLWGIWVLVMLPSFASVLNRWEFLAGFFERVGSLFVSLANGLGVQWIGMLIVLAEAAAFVAAHRLLRRQRVTL